MAYYRNPDWRWEYGSGDAGAGLALMAAVMLLALTVTAVAILLGELVRVFRERAFQKTLTARLLWIALAGLLVIWLAAGLLASSGDPQAGAILAAWGFLAFCLAVEGCDLYERRQPHVDATGLLTYPVAPAALPAAATNRHHKNGTFKELVPEGWMLGEDVQW